MRALVHGLAITGASTVRALRRHGFDVVATDDVIDDAKRRLAGELGVSLLPAPDEPARFVSGFDLLSPAPGVPEGNAVIAAAQAVGVPVQSEIELAYRWEQERPQGPRPIMAITGTDGKTTTTELTVAILGAAGVRTRALGNTDVPLVDALDTDLDAFVVECTSFRLAWTERFRAEAAVWLNLAPDHLNWHASIDSYVAAKSRIFELQRPTDVAIGFIDDPVVMDHLERAPGRHRTFGAASADYRLADGVLTGPDGPIADITVMRRRLPHDITNALAACGTRARDRVGDAGGDRRRVGHLRGAAAPPRTDRIRQWRRLVQRLEGDDTARCVDGDPGVRVPGADRRRKPQGCRSVADGAEPDRLRAVVAIGEAAPDIHAVFDGVTTVVDARQHGRGRRAGGSAVPPGRCRRVVARLRQLRLVQRVPRPR